MQRKRELNLGWAWKPGKATRRAEASNRMRKRRKRRLRKKNRSRKLSSKERLLSSTGDKFYLSRQWLILKRRVLHHYGLRCMRCEAVNTELHVDHIRPKSKAPHLSLTFSNLQVLCRDCNIRKSNLHAIDYREKRRGKVRQWTA